MFELDAEIMRWRQKVLAVSKTITEAEIDELQDHLYGEIRKLQANGLTGEDAFRLATTKLGKIGDLEKEYLKNKPYCFTRGFPMSKYQLAIAGAFTFAIVVITTTILNALVIRPMNERAAFNEAAYLVLLAQTWVELSAERRPAFELELKKNHEIIVNTAPSPTRDLRPASHSLLKRELEARMGKSVNLTSGVDGLVWAQLETWRYRDPATNKWRANFLNVGFEDPMRSVLFSIGAIVSAGGIMLLLGWILILQRFEQPRVA